jgi:hypothetical protein
MPIVIPKGLDKLSLWPNKKQWKSWSLPTKLTAIGALLGFLSFSFYFLEKTFNILDWVLQDDLKTVVKPEVSVDLQFPYERVDESVKQNKRNPELTITNRGSITISPIKVDVNMFVLSPSLDEITSAAILNYRTHGHLILEPELKPGSSVKASLAGIKNWAQPAAYRIRIEMLIPNNKKIPNLSLLYLIDEKGIKAEGSELSKSKAQKIKTAILDFEKSNDAKKKLTLTAPLEGVWVPYAEPGVNLHLNEDGTLTVK